MTSNLLLIPLVGFLVYLNALHGEFVWDDFNLVVYNKLIQSFAYWPQFFTQGLLAGIQESASFYRPLQTLTYAVDYFFWKENPFGYHLTNTLLHTGVAVLTYFFVRRIGKDERVAFWAAAMFVVHPVHVEAVSYISGRADLLAAGFMLFSLLLADQVRTRIWSIGLFALALLSKEQALIFPALLLLCDFYLKKKIQISKIIPYLLVAGVYLFWRFNFVESMRATALADTKFIDRLLGFFVAMAEYPRLLFLPFNLHMEYGRPAFSMSDYRVWVGAGVTAAMIFYIVKNSSARPIGFFCVAWYLLLILPQSNLFPINAYMAEHWLYLPSIGFFILLADLVHFTQFVVGDERSTTKIWWSADQVRFYAVRSKGLTPALLLAGLTIFYSVLTMQQNRVWADAVTLNRHTLKYSSTNPGLLINLSHAYKNLGRPTEAIDILKKSLEIEPNNPDAYYNLANAYKETGDSEKAISMYRKVVEIEPRHAKAWNNLGTVYQKLGRNRQALHAYTQAAQINPRSAASYFNLGLVSKDLRQYEQALAHFKKALSIDSRYPEAHNYLGVTYLLAGNAELAVLSYQKELAIYPGNGAAHNNLAVVYFYNQKYDQAIFHCDEALRLGHKVDPEFLKTVQPFRSSVSKSREV